MKDGKRASKFSLRDRSKKDRALILYNFELKYIKLSWIMKRLLGL